MPLGHHCSSPNSSSCALPRCCVHLCRSSKSQSKNGFESWLWQVFHESRNEAKEPQSQCRRGVTPRFSCASPTAGAGHPCRAFPGHVAKSLMSHQAPQLLGRVTRSNFTSRGARQVLGWGAFDKGGEPSQGCGQSQEPGCTHRGTAMNPAPHAYLLHTHPGRARQAFFCSCLFSSQCYHPPLMKGWGSG